MKKKKIFNTSEIILISLSFITISLFFYIQCNFYFDIKKDIGSKNIKSSLFLATDKQEYAPEEPIKIIVRNLSANPFSNSSETSGVLINSRNFFGENYGIGLIEKNENNIWTAVEAIWRCGKKCSEKCDVNPILEPFGLKVFVWSQKIIQCDDRQEGETLDLAEAGMYRATIAAWDKSKNKYELIHSNTFGIAD